MNTDEMLESKLIRVPNWVFVHIVKNVSFGETIADVVIRKFDLKKPKELKEYESELEAERLARKEEKKKSSKSKRNLGNK